MSICFRIFITKQGSHPIFPQQKNWFSPAFSCAEGQGFEPWEPFQAQWFSRPSRSTAPSSFRILSKKCLLIKALPESVFRYFSKL